MICLIESCGTNFASIQFALERLGKSSVVTRNPVKIQAASHVILPGVGNAQHVMQQLADDSLVDVIRSLQQPVLGICVGMQILYDYSQEGQVECLKILAGAVMPLATVALPVPHMGWNKLHLNATESALLQRVPDLSYLYYVHSFAADVTANTLATTHYGDCFSAVVQHQNFYGVQFHPERSGRIGAIILENFLAI